MNGPSRSLTAFPYFVFVDAEGRVVGRATGEISPKSLTKVFKQLAEGAASSETSNGPSTSKDQ